MIGELAFTFYVDVYGFSNLVGHFMKITAFGFIYLAIIHVSIQRPFSSLFKSIQEKEQEVKEINETLRITGKMLRHDMTNQLHILNSIIELQKDSMEEFDMALRVIGRCQQLIRDARILSDVAGSAEDMSPYSVRETVIEALETCHIDYSIEGEGTVYGDRTLVSAICNIIQNSIIHSGTEKIDIIIQNQGELCELRIIDYGSGIPNDIKGVLFQQGVKYGPTAGTGMGIYIASTIINRLEGNISYKPNHPTGSMFILHLRTA